MEAKKFISTLKGIRTRYSKNPNADAEKKAVETLSEKFGGKLEAIASLKENGQEELKDYLKGILGLNVFKKSEPSVSKPEAPKASKVFTDIKGNEFTTVDGKFYKVDSINKTVKRVYRDLSDLADLDIESLGKMPMTTYQRYLRDNFPGEDCPIKKGKLHFRGYRISCDSENGFLIEDTTKRYEVADTPFEGIPTPKELGDWFGTSKREFTQEELKEAVKRGKELERKKAEEKKSKKEETPVEVDYEKLRRKTLRMIGDARSKIKELDPLALPEVIPFKRWQRKIRSYITQWKNREIRYPKFLRLVEEYTTEETFEIKEKNHRSSFKGTLLPEHEKVGMLVGDKIEVDGKWIDAVPFLLEYLLHYEYRAMAQIMKYASGEITDVELIKNPIEQDWKVEYNRRALENTAHNARVLSMVYEQVGVVTPQDLLYDADLEVGDKILIFVDGEPKTTTVRSVEKGITLSKEVGLLKLDKWIKLPKKDKQ